LVLVLLYCKIYSRPIYGTAIVVDFGVKVGCWMSKMKYSSGLISQSFWFIEFKKVIKLLHDGKTYDDIKRLCLEENLFGASKENRARRMFGYISTRAKTFDSEMIELFNTSHIATQKTMTLFAIVKSDKLFSEFLYEVYREKVILGINQLDDSDTNIFFKNKQAQNEDIASWSDVTLNKLRNCYTNYLTDAGLLTISSGKKNITPPILDKELEMCLLTHYDEQFIKAITGVN